LIITGEPGNVLKRGARGEANGEAASDAKNIADGEGCEVWIPQAASQ
jgi:hypothetical protein